MPTPARTSALRPLHPANLAKSRLRPPLVQQVEIKVNDPLDHTAPAILHAPPESDTQKANGAAVVLISGAGGGTSGPGGIYPSLADKFAALLGIPCVRLDYRRPARNTYCTPDVLASLDYLDRHFGSSRFVVVGWSFGGSPCFTVAAREPKRVAGVVTVASQTADTDGILKLSPRPLLLLHGTGDTTLSPRCSHNLYRAYGDDPRGTRTLRLFEGDNHGLTRNATEAEQLIFEFAARVLGFSPDSEEAAENLTGDTQQRVQQMHEGHDLENGERL
ncbi:hypothetical protein EVJ58_g871 [Rhodofomes roseus]|uniref:AB hydrolase-1 domain-containing protein n=1 Tax=Rhodofomes roseus TaxID=34475 RepID=A0A4Y9Z485_9APHY|nr:hypothetical protein EVJ58_g871 [Rhodofomes roseus]